MTVYVVHTETFPEWVEIPSGIYWMPYPYPPISVEEYEKLNHAPMPNRGINWEKPHDD